MGDGRNLVQAYFGMGVGGAIVVALEDSDDKLEAEQAGEVLGYAALAVPGQPLSHAAGASGVCQDEDRHFYF